jgi:hypothetical protein
MTINHEKKLIFIHIPKTAGTSVHASLGVKETLLNNKFVGHKSICDYKKQYKNYWNIYLKFTVVRDPIDRFISAYKFMKMEENFWHSPNNPNKYPIHEHYKICNSLDINQYISYLSKTTKNHSMLTVPQIFFIMDKYEKIEIDYIAKYENLNNDLKKIGIDLVDRLNISTIKDKSSIQLTKKSKKMLYDIYDMDYQYFSYIKDVKNIFSYD